MGFGELCERLSARLARPQPGDSAPLTLSGRLFNEAFLLNSHDLATYFRLSLTFLEEDASLWGL